MTADAGRPVPAIQFTCYDVNIAGVQVTPIRPSFSDFIDAHPASFADSPTSLRGDISKCVDDVQRWRDELGISYWNLGGNLDAIAPIVARLSTGQALGHLTYHGHAVGAHMHARRKKRTRADQMG